MSARGSLIWRGARDGSVPPHLTLLVVSWSTLRVHEAAALFPLRGHTHQQQQERGVGRSCTPTGTSPIARRLQPRQHARHTPIPFAAPTHHCTEHERLWTARGTHPLLLALLVLWGHTRRTDKVHTQCYVMACRNTCPTQERLPWQGRHCHAGLQQRKSRQGRAGHTHTSARKSHTPPGVPSFSTHTPPPSQTGLCSTSPCLARTARST